MIAIFSKTFLSDMDKIQEIFGFHIIALIVSSSEVLGLSLDPIRLI